MKMSRRAAAVICSILTLIMLLPFPVMAAGGIDLSKEVTLSLSYKDETTSITGAQFDIYLIAKVDEGGELTPTDVFSQFPVDIRGKNDEAWKNLASTLEGYILRDKIAPTDTGKTDANGQLNYPTEAFRKNSGKGLTAGLYLVMGKQHTQGNYKYDASSFIVQLPELNSETNVWNYKVGTSPKFTRTNKPGEESGGGSVSRKALKVWSDSGHEIDRPQEVTVQLLQDGDVYDTATLSADNNWRYTWSKLPSGHSWRVTEEVPSGYTVSISSEGTTFVVRNSYNPERPPEEIEDGGTPLGHMDFDTIEDMPIPLAVLPQTGTLWWLVPILAAVGTLMIVLGLVRRKYSGE